ncbi:hypothetical protein Bca52824_016740 [Brassica carinata]|uniref:Uncharacterized protein n=1 Tax=Brassica carinata TaxID=52824 RepID=A0A8X8B6T6_BRACI|nr:hypothetical protein Bca52824_016740 [Brassica carinata]
MDPPPPSGSQPPQKAVPRLATVGWRTMLIFNLGLAAFIFAKKREKDIDAGEKMGVKKASKGAKKSAVNTEVEKKVAETAVPEKEEAKPIPKPDPLSEFTDSAAADDESAFHGGVEQVKVARKPIPEDEQRELFKWILEEKSRMEPKDRKEKKQIDEEKAVLKQFIRAERVPKLLPDDSVDSSLRDWDKFFSSK